MLALSICLTVPNINVYYLETIRLIGIKLREYVEPYQHFVRFSFQRYLINWIFIDGLIFMKIDMHHFTCATRKQKLKLIYTLD